MRNFFLAMWYLVVALLAIIAGMIANGIVLSIMWGWFMAPVFSLPRLSIIAAVGITITFSISFGRESEIMKSAYKEEMTAAFVIKHIAQTVVAAAIILFFGWLAHLCMINAVLG